MMPQTQLQSPSVDMESQLRQKILQEHQRQQQQQQRQQQFNQGSMLGLLNPGPSPPRFTGPQPSPTGTYFKIFCQYKGARIIRTKIREIFVRIKQNVCIIYALKSMG